MPACETAGSSISRYCREIEHRQCAIFKISSTLTDTCEQGFIGVQVNFFWNSVLQCDIFSCSWNVEFSQFDFSFLMFCMSCGSLDVLSLSRHFYITTKRGVLFPMRLLSCVLNITGSTVILNINLNTWHPWANIFLLFLFRLWFLFKFHTRPIRDSIRPSSTDSVLQVR